MPISILVARVLHIFMGVFWVGAIFFNAWFLIPAMLEAGPDSAKVNAALTRRGFMKIMPIMALITILSGFWLYWKMSFGFQAEYMGSARGMVYGAGSVAAVLAFILGMSVMRPSMMKAGALAQSAATAGEAERPAIVAEAGRLRMRGARAARIVALLLVFATLAMAVGRYV